MKKFKSYIAGIVTGMLLFSIPAVASGVKEMIEVYFNTITVTVDGVKVEADNILYNDRTYVPLRAISEITGKQVDWDDAAKTANIHDPYGVTYSGDVIGTVNGTEIKSEQMEAYKSLVKIENPEMTDKEIERLAKENIVYNIVLKDFAKKSGIEINADSDAQYSAELSFLNSQYPQFMQFIQMMGFTEKSFKQKWETEYLTRMLISNVPASFSATEEEIEAYYNTNKEMFEYDGLVAKHILISTTDENGQPLSEEKKAELKNVVDDIYAQIKNGADFDSLMLEFGEDPGVEQNPDGYKFKRGDMVAEFEEAAYALEIGEVSEPVLSSYGYHIIKLIDKIDYLSLEDARESIESDIATEKVQIAVKKLIPSYTVNWK